MGCEQRFLILIYTNNKDKLKFIALIIIVILFSVFPLFAVHMKYILHNCIYNVCILFVYLLT